jgi:hypothetical protein
MMNNDCRTALVSTVFFFPTAQPVTVLNMNCTYGLRSGEWLTIDAAVVVAGVGLFAFVWWWAGARNYCAFPSCAC